MDPKFLNDIRNFIEPNIEYFHSTRISSLKKLKLKTVLKRKNPYLFKAKNVLKAHDLVKLILDAYLSSQEEGIFGGFLETLAIFVCEWVYRGQKSVAEGIDLEFVKSGNRYIVSIKSGPNWGNSQQIKKMRDNFRKAKRIYRTNVKDNLPIIAVNGCCYGIDNKPDKGDYFKLCGQRFWELISGVENLYIEIIEPLGYKARIKNENFKQEYAKIINRFTREFTEEFCSEEGEIMWDKLLEFNSGRPKDSSAIS